MKIDNAIPSEDYEEYDIRVSRLALMVLRDQMRLDEEETWSTFCHLKYYLQKEKIDDDLAIKIIADMLLSIVDVDITKNRKYIDSCKRIEIRKRLKSIKPQNPSQSK